MNRSRERDLAAYYDAEAGARSELSDRRVVLHGGTVERYDTFVTSNRGWEYQFVLLRV